MGPKNPNWEPDDDELIAIRQKAIWKIKAMILDIEPDIEERIAREDAELRRRFGTPA